ncbi:MAG: hypothetical protein LBI03_10425 [Clostridiales bacterium]|jgi:glycosyl-4,4'-diaponeurosporenoate acyltransferase|nr:hypothetical protein [Clostridiales bacterium]
MQIFYLSAPWTIGLCFAGWLIIQLGTALICFKIPSKQFNSESWLFQIYPWEKNGKLFSFLNVRHWKHLLPDGAAIMKGGYRKKNLTDYSPKNLDKFVVESCRAELTHLLAILPFWIFGFIGPPIIIVFMFIYALAVNLPCIIVQRYNRPRIIALEKKLDEKNVI